MSNLMLSVLYHACTRRPSRWRTYDEKEACHVDKVHWHTTPRVFCSMSQPKCTSKQHIYSHFWNFFIHNTNRYVFTRKPNSRMLIQRHYSLRLYFLFPGTNNLEKISKFVFVTLKTNTTLLSKGEVLFFWLNSYDNNRSRIRPIAIIFSKRLFALVV